MRRELSKADVEALSFLKTQGEVIRRGSYWGTQTRCPIDGKRMSSLQQRSLVSISTLGESEFASISERGIAALDRANEVAS
jgi:hypothetical protein